jgi:hypothetical protein
MAALLGEPRERDALVEDTVVDDRVDPVRELRAHVVEVAEPAAIEK